jgi:catalase
MQAMQPKGRVSYEPSSLSQDAPRESPAIGFRSAVANESGGKGRLRAESFADHYSQARQFYRSQTGYEQAHIASALIFELSKVAHVHVRQAIVAHLRHIEEDLAKRVANGLALDTLPSAPPAAASVQDRELSPALQIIGKMKGTLDGRAIGILIADGSDGAVIDKVRKAAVGAGAMVKIVAPKVGGAKLADGSLLVADGQLAGTPSVLFDAISVILSDKSAKLLTMESAAIDFVHDAYAHLKAIAADKGGRKLLLKANIERDKGVVDVGDLAGFISAAKTRQWDREALVRSLA